MYQAQLINTEILSDTIKRNNKYNWTHIYVFSGRRNQYTNTNDVLSSLWQFHTGGLSQQSRNVSVKLK